MSPDREKRRVFAICGADPPEGREPKSWSSSGWAPCLEQAVAREKGSDFCQVLRLHCIHMIVTGLLPIARPRLPQ